MSSRGLATAAILLLLATGPAFAADPGARAPITVGGAVNDVALAWQTGALGVGHQDPGSRTSVPPAPTADAWHLYSSGLDEIQSGHADIAACEDNALFDDCQTHATHVAISQDGARMVVGSTPDSGNAILTFIREASGDDHRLQLGNGALRDLEMSDNGQTVVAVTDLGTGTNNRGRVYLVNWASGTAAPSVLWSDELLTGATDVALSPDGNAITVAEGPRHHHYARTSAGTQFTEDNGGTGMDVAVSNGPQHLAVAGWSTGYFLLYNDATGNGRHEYQLRPGTGSLDAVAIRNDGTAIAVGNGAGSVWVYKVDPVLVRATTPALGQVSLTGAVREIAFARDGNSFAVAHGDQVTHYAIDGTALVKLWSATVPNAGGDIAIDEKGDRLATSSGSSAIVYQAVHRINVTKPSLPSATPGQTHSVTVGYTNAGNRIETVTLALQAPAGWTAVPDKTSLRLLPDQAATVRLNVTVPQNEAPGTKDVRIVHTAGAAGTATTVLGFTVPTIEAWSLSPAGSSSLGVQAGGSNSYVVNVTNRGNVVKVPPLSVAASPAGWTATLVGNDGNLPAGAARQVVVTLTAPDGAAQLAQGRATVTLPGATGSPLVLTATVGASFNIDLSGPSEATAKAGNTTRLQLTVKNNGNAPDGVTLEATTLPTGWTATFPGGATVQGIPAGESRTVAVDVAVPAGVFDPSPVVFTATSGGDASRVDSHTVTVEQDATASSSTTSSSGGKKGSPALAPLLLVGTLAAVALALGRRRQ